MLDGGLASYVAFHLPTRRTFPGDFYVLHATPRTLAAPSLLDRCRFNVFSELKDRSILIFNMLNDSRTFHVSFSFQFQPGKGLLMS